MAYKIFEDTEGGYGKDFDPGPFEDTAPAVGSVTTTTPATTPTTTNATAATTPTPGMETRAGFDEAHYLRAYPDVAAAVAAGQLSSAWEHYIRFGRAEGRYAVFSAGAPTTTATTTNQTPGANTPAGTSANTPAGTSAGAAPETEAPAKSAPAELLGIPVGYWIAGAAAFLLLRD